MGLSGQLHAPDILLPGKQPPPPQSLSGRECFKTWLHTGCARNLWSVLHQGGLCCLTIRSNVLP